jgi:hypothetical protein
LALASYTGTLCNLLQDIGGLLRENEDPLESRGIALQFLVAIYENLDEWRNIELYVQEHFYLIRNAELIYKAKRPILYRLHKLNDIFSDKTLVAFNEYNDFYDGLLKNNVLC